MSGIGPRIKLVPHAYETLRQWVLQRDNWRCQGYGSMQNLDIHHKTLRSQQGDDQEENLITLCNSCHSSEHS